MNSSLCSLPGENILVMSREDVNEISSQHPDIDGDVEETGLFIWNYNKIDGFRAKGAESKILHTPFAMLLSLGAL